MLDFVADIVIGGPRAGHVGGNLAFWIAKRVFDILCAIALLPLLILIIPIVALVNLEFNKGPLFFVQSRMGKDCQAFNAMKFRTMRRVAQITRGHDDPIEHDRISAFGRFLRKTRIDELPQIINVLKGDMSMIGPRPDYYEHAKVYLREIPEYRQRHAVRPGITGLSQVSLGYIEGCDATRNKARMDLTYVRDAGFALDTKIALQTLAVILHMGGA